MTSGKRFTPGRIFLFIVLVAIVVWVDGDRKIPSGPASGVSLEGPAPASRPSGDTIRVATYNIDGGVGSPDERFDLDRTASALKGFDLIGLEEVHGSMTDNQAHILGGKLNLPWLYAPVESQYWHDAFGDAILTSLAPIHWQRIPLANAVADSNRELLWAQVQLNGKTVNVLITHLERHDDNAPELTTAITLFQSLQSPAILMGDLNTGKDNAQLVALSKVPGVVDPIAGAINDQFKNSADWIFARGFKVDSAGLSDNGASDHPMAWAELTLSDEK